MNLIDKPDGRKILFAFLYLSEGAPIGFIWWALPTLLRLQKIPVDQITSLTAILVFPWALKFIWAPLVDTLHSSRWGFKGWIISMQIIMGLTFLPLMFLDLTKNFDLIRIFLILHAFAAATQDVSIDAFAINTISEDERGIINGYMNAGMLTGRSLFGGGTLLAVSWIGWQGIFPLLVIFIWASMFLLFFVKESGEKKSENKENFSDFLNHFLIAFRKPSTWFGIMFALIGASGFEALGALAGPFLVDRNISQDVIGIFFSLPSVLAMLVGGMIGGKASDKIGRKKAVSLSLTGFSSLIILLAAGDYFYNGLPELLLISTLTLIYLFIGIFTASSYALFMDLTNPKLGATQFSTFMAATNGCEAWSAWAGGNITAGVGYPAAFVVMSLVSFGSLFFVKKIRQITPSR